MSLSFFMGMTGSGGGFVCPSPSLSPVSGSGLNSVTVSSSLVGSRIFYKKSNTGALPTHTGSTADAGTTRIGTGSGTPSAVVSVGAGNFLEALTYLAGYRDSPVEEGYYGTEVIEP